MKNQPQLIQQQSPQHQRDLTQQQCQNQQQQNIPEQGDNRNGSAGRPPPRQYQGGHGQRQGGPPHHGYSQNRRWHPNQKVQGYGQTNVTGDKGVPPRTTKDKQTENVKPGEEQISAPQDFRSPTESPRPESAPNTNAFPQPPVKKESPNPPGSRKASEGQSERPKIDLLQSSKERLRRRLKDKVRKSCLGPVSQS